MLKNIKVKFPFDVVGFFEKYFGKKDEAVMADVAKPVEIPKGSARLVASRAFRSRSGLKTLQPGIYTLSKVILENGEVWYKVVGKGCAIPEVGYNDMVQMGVLVLG